MNKYLISEKDESWHGRDTIACCSFRAVVNINFQKDSSWISPC